MRGSIWLTHGHRDGLESGLFRNLPTGPGQSVVDWTNKLTALLFFMLSPFGLSTLLLARL